MDDDTGDLVRQLSTRAGMIMEDASANAILVGGKTPGELRSIVGGLEIMMNQAGAIISAAKALIR
jgi:hypothetical protein